MFTIQYCSNVEEASTNCQCRRSLDKLSIYSVSSQDQMLEWHRMFDWGNIWKQCRELREPVWRYIDLKGEVQGPFPSSQIAWLVHQRLPWHTWTTHLWHSKHLYTAICIDNSKNIPRRTLKQLSVTNTGMQSNKAHKWFAKSEASSHAKLLNIKFVACRITVTLSSCST